MMRHNNDVSTMDYVVILFLLLILLATTTDNNRFFLPSFPILLHHYTHIITKRCV